MILDDESRIHFTKLIYALGSECFIPPIAGSNQPEVVAIRRLSDVEKVERLYKEERVKNAVVIGGGVLGLEACMGIEKAGLHVEVLEAAPVLMGRQLDAGSAKLLQEIAEKNDVKIHTGVSIEAIEGDGCVTGVRLADGTVYPAELVIVSAGVRANVKLAQEIGLEVERAVIVNERMETNIPGIYACGDCAQYQGINYAIWPEAMEEGKIAGTNAAGEEKEYQPVSAALTFRNEYGSICSRR